MSTIKFASTILKALGEELNSTPELGLLELVKNSYDADAKTCTITLSNVEKEGGTITIEDDGDGMSIEDIDDSWLVVGSSKKNTDSMTRLGRIPAGSKGLGRLAALRLGSETTLTTKAKNSGAGKLEINWNDYKDTRLVNDVILQIEESTWTGQEEKGTVVRIDKLQQGLNKATIKRLARSLILLADPFSTGENSFNPILVSPEFKDLEALVKKRYFDQAEFHLSATVKDGISSIKLNDWKGQVLFEGDHKSIKRREPEPYICPDSELHVWVFLLNQDIFSTRGVSLTEVRNWLNDFGGIHLYENEIRVNPYGNSGDDWLEINLSRAKSPEERPSTNTVIGRAIINDRDSKLIQKTDRSGFIENDEFLSLKSFGKDCMDWMARKRLQLAEVSRTKKRVEVKSKSENESKKVENAIEKVAPKNREEVKESFEKFKKAKEREVKSLHKEVQLYRTLSSAGITASTFAHESEGNPLKVISISNKAIQTAGKKNFKEQFEKYIKRPSERIGDSIESLSVLSTVTLNLLEHEKRRLSKVFVHKVVNRIVDIFDPFIRGRKVELVTKLDLSDPYLRCSEAAIESIVSNLINNSLSALEFPGLQKRSILVTTELLDGELEMSVSDTGPGIQSIDKDEIWLPGKTTKENGTGLGLTIVRDTVVDLGGSVLAEPKSDLGGARISLIIPILGS